MYASAGSRNRVFSNDARTGKRIRMTGAACAGSPKPVVRPAGHIEASPQPDDGVRRSCGNRLKAVLFSLALGSAWFGNSPALAHYKLVGVAVTLSMLGQWFGLIYLRRRWSTLQRYAWDKQIEMSASPLL